jgi:hypothetical protein
MRLSYWLASAVERQMVVVAVRGELLPNGGWGANFHADQGSGNAAAKRFFFNKMMTACLSREMIFYGQTADPKLAADTGHFADRCDSGSMDSAGPSGDIGAVSSATVSFTFASAGRLLFL